INRRADAQLLRAVAPMLHAMPRAKPGETPRVIHIDLAGMPRHRLSHAKNIRAAAAQKCEPEPKVGGEFGVVPRKAADVVTPDMPRRIVGVHHVAVIPKS